MSPGTLCRLTALSLLLGGCSLTEVTTTAAEDVVVVEALLLRRDDGGVTPSRIQVLLHRTVQQCLSHFC